MSQFIQLHLLTAYPPSNLNRDDLGRPKTAVVGGVQRLRVSSQSLKRAWRTSDLFRARVDGHVGLRTKEMGQLLIERMIKRGMAPELASKWANTLMETIGKLKSEGDQASHETMVFYDESERAILEQTVDSLDANSPAPDSKKDKKDLAKTLLRKKVSSLDLAMFGRMLAEVPEFNIEAAVQVSHAFTVNKAAVEDDYFTAVDDLNAAKDETGAGHVGEAEFGSGLFYTYVCINRTLLEQNIGADKQDLVPMAIKALAETAAKVGPNGKQNSFASRAYASYVLAEKGEFEPRTLGFAFFEPVSGANLIASAIQRLNEHRKNLDAAYGMSAVSFKEMDAFHGKGSMDELIRFVAEG